MTDKFNNLINSTFAGLIEETPVAPSAKEVVQNPELQLQQQADAITAAGGAKKPQEKELMKKAKQLKDNAGKKAGDAVDKVNELEQAQQEVSS